MYRSYCKGDLGHYQTHVSHYKIVIVATDEVITATLFFFISATTKMILATEEVIKVSSPTTNEAERAD